MVTILIASFRVEVRPAFCPPVHSPGVLDRRSGRGRLR
jgi:hypothetical protein